MVKRPPIFILALLLFLLTTCALPLATAEIPAAGLASYQVVDPDGKAIAQVEDVLIAADSGQISYALVVLRRDPFSYGKAAFTDAAVPRTAVPWEYLSLDSASGQLQLSVDSAVLYAAPLLKDKPDQLASDWDVAIQAYWQTSAISSAQE